VAAFRASEKPHFAFIGRPKLAEPPESKVVLALGAFHLDSGKRFYLIFFIVNNSNLVFRAFFLKSHLAVIFFFYLPDISALAALELASG